ncbi:[LysW]-aminoadipate kinase [Acanthopleuribacter pedis]|uniref:Acetylglutamate kinase n=1 Tax=Acanthopleuribacter pedis TaxID=442870 RepID=A0A8J7QIY6_9BACT|nr:[LysW]-aminoadipate kinase [Acanthopleuribacter pedis]
MTNTGLTIIKVGGGAAINLQGVAEDLAQIDGPKIVVLGANAVRNQLARELGREVRTVTSLSGHTSVFSDEHMIDLIFMSYAGLQNKKMVSWCRQAGVNAVGLTGLDGGLIQGRRNRGIKTRVDGKKMVLRDHSGKPVSVNDQLLRTLLKDGYTPVLSIPIADEDGRPLNSENDDIVALLHQSLQAQNVVQLIEAPGLMGDMDDPGSLVSRLSAEELRQWETRVEGRMRRKLTALNRLFENGATRLVIADGRGPQPISHALAGEGTVIECQPQPC